MTLITDPDNLTATEVTVDEGARTVTLNIAGNLSIDGVTLQCLYSYLKELWISDSSLQPYPFPLVSITPEKMDWLYNWELAADASRKLIRNGGWREYDSVDSLKEEWVGCISLDTGVGTIDPGDTAYYNFSSQATKADFTYDGVVNEAIQTFGDASHGDFDYRTDVLSLYIREQGKTYAQSSSTGIGYSIDDYSVGRYPLGEGTDLNISASDNDIETTTPYTNMSIEFYSTPTAKDIPSSGDPHNFGINITGATGTITQIYEYLQHELRQNSDIDHEGTSGQIGLLTDSFAVFIGTRLDTLAVTNSEGGGTGTFLTNVATADTNNMRMLDNLGAYYEYPFVSTGRISFNANISGDAAAIYRMYWRYTEGTTVSDCSIENTAGNNSDFVSSGNLPLLVADDYFIVEGAANAENNGIWVATGTPTTSLLNADKYDGIAPSDETTFSALIGVNPYESPDALIVDNNSDVDIAGTVSAATYIDFDFDYDGNDQGGRATADAEVVIMCIGEEVATFATANLTIERKIGNNISVVASLERNYENP